MSRLGTAIVVDPSDLFNALSGLLFTGLGVFVAFVRPRSRASVALATFACSFGLAWLFNYGTALIDPQGALELAMFSGVSVSLVVAAAALVVLALVFPRPMGAEGRGPVLALGLAALAYAVAASMPDAATWGRAAAADHPRTLMFASFFFAGLVMVRHFRAAVVAGRRDEAAQVPLVAAALLFYPGAITGMGLAGDASSPMRGLAGLAVLVIIAGLWLAAGRRGDARARRIARNVAILSLAVPLVALVITILQGGEAIASSGIPPGLARAVTVIVLVYAILHHQILGMDLKVRWTIRQSTIGAMFIAVFFVVSELAAEVFTSRTGTIVGVVAAGALVFVLSPLQGVAERVATAAVPVPADTRPPPGARTADLYRSTVRRLLADGVLSRDDERILAHLAQELGIGAGDALDLRHEVEARHGAGDARQR